MNGTKRDEVFCDTDVLAAYLEYEGNGASALKQLMTAAVCFTSVLNAGELIAATESEDERRHAESVLWGLKVLGFHHKYALRFGDAHRAAHREARQAGGADFRDSMVAGMCIISKLPLCTCNPSRYRAYKGLTLIDAADAAASTPEELKRLVEEAGKKARG